MPFIAGIWNEPPKEIINSIDISSSSVTLTHILSVESGGEYYSSFGVTLFSNKFDFNDRRLIRKINKPSLKKAIFNSLDARDQKYYEIVGFTTRNVKFKFLWRKWMNDSLQGVNPKTHMSKFEKSFKLRVQLPNMLAFNFTPYTDKFIVKKFRKLTSERKMDKWFKGFIPKEYENKIRIKTSDMFDYNYDNQFNKVILRLKNVYILGILFAVGETVKSNTAQPYVKVNFNKKVKNKANNFDRKKWESFINKRFY
jgi:hypothetical protein